MIIKIKLIYTSCLTSLRILGNYEGSWKSPNFIESLPNAEHFVSTSKNFLKKRTRYFLWKLESIYNILWMIAVCWMILKSKSRHSLSKMSWFRLSKAFCRLMRIIQVNRQESKPDSILSVKYERVASVQWF